MDNLFRKRRPTGKDMQQSRRTGYESSRTVCRERLPGVHPLLMLCSLILLFGVGCNRGAGSTATAETGPMQTAGTVPQRSVAAGAGQGGGTGVDQDKAVAERPGQDTRVLVSYFHTTFRCPTCTQLEAYSQETVERDFAREVAENRVVFRSVNVQEPENEHYVQDYKLYTKSLVVSLSRNGREVRWKNLPDIWKHVRNRDRFDQYVREEIQAFLRDS